MDKLDKYIDEAKEIVQGVIKDTRAGKEIREGITRLEELPEIEGSILYKMELEAVISYLSSLYLIINDNRLDNASVEEELRKVMDKIQPAADPQETEELQAIENAKAIAYDACTKAMEIIERRI